MKTRMLSRIIAVVLILSLIFVLTACSSKKDKLIGTWVDSDKTEELTFNKDGTFTYTVYGNANGTGTYEVEDDTLTANFDNGVTITATIDFPNNNTLHLTSGQLGGTAVYNKK